MENISYQVDKRDFVDPVILNMAIEYFDKEYRQNIKTNKIDQTSFTGIYSKTEIDRDLLYVYNKKEEFRQKNAGDFKSKENKKISEAFEKIISLRGEQNDWFGNNFYTSNTSDYDDFKNKADILGAFVVEGEEKEINNFMGVVFDITSATGQNLMNKLQSNINRLSGNLPEPEIKYFENEKIKFKGGLKKIIPLVIGLDSNHTKNLIVELYKADNDKRRQEMTDHPCSIVFLREIIIQLEEYEKTLQKNDPKKFLPKIKKILPVIERIISLKERLVEDPKTKELLAKDNVMREIKNFCEFRRGIDKFSENS